MSSSRTVVEAAALTLLAFFGLTVAGLLLRTNGAADAETSSPETTATVLQRADPAVPIEDRFDTLDADPLPTTPPTVLLRAETNAAPGILVEGPGTGRVIVAEGATVAGRSQVAIRSGEIDTWPEQSRQLDARESNWGPEPTFPTMTLPNLGGSAGNIDTWEDTDPEPAARESNWGPEPTFPQITVPQFSAARQEIDTWADREPAERSESDWGVEAPIPTPTTLRIEVIRGEVDTWPDHNGVERDVSRAAVAALPTTDVVSTRTVSPTIPVVVARTDPSPPATAAPATTAPVTTTTTLQAVARELSLGSSGVEVEALQRRLLELGYQPGEVDGEFGFATRSAVWAYQKVNDLPATGIVDEALLARLAGTAQATPRVIGTGAKRIDVSLDDQLLVLYENDTPTLISHISSGNGEDYCAEGRCGVADTPTGNYSYQRYIDGWRTSYLGRLYNPMYFSGGYAIHGSSSVPLTPASHGCIRIPMHVAEKLPGMVSLGTPITIS